MDHSYCPFSCNSMFSANVIPVLGLIGLRHYWETLVASDFSVDENRPGGTGKDSETTFLFVTTLDNSISELLTLVNFWNGDSAKQHVFQTDWTGTPNCEHSPPRRPIGV